MLAKRLILGGLLGLVLVTGVGAAWVIRCREPELRLPGLVEIQEVRLSSKVSGRVKEVLVEEGATVSPNQPLVVFAVPELEARRDQTKAQHEAALAMLEKARNGARPEEKAAAKAALESARARHERLKNGFRPEEVEIAQKDYEGLSTDLEKANKDFLREQQLRTTGGTSAAQLDAAWASFARLRDQAKGAKARWTMMAKGARPEEIAEAAAEVAKAQANLELLEQGTRAEDIAQVQAQANEIYARLREIEVNLQEAVVVAPGKALVEVITVRPGDNVAPNHPVVRVLRAEDRWVKAYVPETELGKIRLNQKVHVTNDSYPGKRFEGTVTFIAAVSEFTPRNVQSADERRNQMFALKIRIDDAEGIFKSGMAAEVLIPLHTK